MSHVDDKVIELARAALSFEFSSEPFFRHAASLTRNDSGKKMFLRLAKKDDERMDDLTELLDSFEALGITNTKENTDAT